MLQALAISVMVNGYKCFYATVPQTDILVFKYNTTDISDDRRGNIEIHFNYTIHDSVGTALKSGIITGIGKEELSVSNGQYSVCLDVHIPENTKYSSKQHSRVIRRLDIVFSGSNDIDQSADTTENDIGKADYLVRKSKAIGSQQSGSEYRRVRIEKAGKHLKVQSKIATMFTCVVYIVLTILSSKFIKNYLKSKRI
ncbi:GOLD domain-containing protein [Spironucleus salmonicida]|uniref:GOLD domain-containing protein n=1 Tax=Spironucleus salmonicida TaxID=348837 RepID=V6LCJ0_9EUKA|nr:GOLD domain-containing protein [Spironucleus salmonicida]|eukprot:EST42162.1 GOLD domain-containing protein [Spironucleus salmonicida]